MRRTRRGNPRSTTVPRTSSQTLKVRVPNSHALVVWNRGTINPQIKGTSTRNTATPCQRGSRSSLKAKSLSERSFFFTSSERLAQHYDRAKRRAGIVDRL
jgi:hypothetical protein